MKQDDNETQRGLSHEAASETANATCFGQTTPEGKKELVGFQLGTRESAQSWRELLVDLKGRGLAVVPKLVVGDGAFGFWKALEEVFPSTRHQRLLGAQGGQRPQRGAEFHGAAGQGGT
jgi:hypothetical protein